MRARLEKFAQAPGKMLIACSCIFHILGDCNERQWHFQQGVFECVVFQNNMVDLVFFWLVRAARTDKLKSKNCNWRVRTGQYVLHMWKRVRIKYYNHLSEAR